MDFDHRDGETKLFNIGNATNFDRQRILAEIHKCDLVCANCHRIRTQLRLYLKRQARLADPYVATYDAPDEVLECSTLI
jgi:hypothetical protein